MKTPLIGVSSPYTKNLETGDDQVVIKADTKINIDSPVVGIGGFTTNSTPTATLHISGAGDTNVLVEGHITASGNISSSGGTSIFGQVVHLEGTDPRLKLKAKGANHPGIEWHEDSTRKWVLYNDPDESDKLVFKNDDTELVKINQAGAT